MTEFETNPTIETRVALVFSGGIGLGAYQAGAFAALQAGAPGRIDWLAASSAGVANAAVIAGNAEENRLSRLREFWTLANVPPASIAQHATGLGTAWRHAYNWSRVLQTRLLGSPGQFRPRYLAPLTRPFVSLYDLGPLRQTLERMVDFGRLNSGEIRVSVATTDIETGETVVFDTHKGDRIEVDHLLASAGFIPEFQPVEIGGRWLGDGGLSSNAPVEAVLEEVEDGSFDRICFIVDLFARDGARPLSLEAALARKNDLLFGNQTYKRLELHRREIEREQALSALREQPPAELRDSVGGMRTRSSCVRALLYLSYRAPPEEAGPEKPYDLSSATAQDRWRAGELDMEEALQALAGLERPLRGCILRAIRRHA